MDSFRDSCRRYDGLVIMLMTCCVYVVAHRASLTNAFVINDDVRQQIFWMRQYLSPELYPSSILVDYAKSYVPYGVRWIYWLGSFFMDPVQFTKVVTGGLFVMLAVVMSEMGRYFVGRIGGYVAAVVVWLMPFFLNNISGGLSRGFAAPLLALFALGLLRKRAWVVFCALVLMALCIPYIWVLAAGASLLGFFAGYIYKEWRPVFPQTWLQCFLGGCTAIPVWLFKSQMDVLGFGPLAAMADMVDSHGVPLPLYTQAGRFEILPLPNPFIDLVYHPFEKIGLFLDLGLFAGILSLVVLLSFLVLGFRRVDWREMGRKAQPIIVVGLSSLLLYVAARSMVVKLFVPDRYVQYSVALAYALFFTIIFAALVKAWKVSARVKIGVLLVCCLLAMIRLSGESLYDYREDSALASIVQESPVESIFAGPPRQMDNVLTFGQRDVLFSFELAHPWNLGYWRAIEPRLKDTIHVLFAERIDAVRQFAKKYNVHFMIVDPDWFHDDTAVRDGLFAPYADEAISIKHQSTSFFFEKQSQLPRVDLPDGRNIVDLRPLL